MSERRGSSVKLDESPSEAIAEDEALEEEP